MAVKIATFDSEGFCGYKQITTFFEDFSIADNFGDKAIKDTYRRAFSAWKSDYKYVTELCMVLNWKCWQWSGKNNNRSELYADMFYKLQEWCYDNLKGEELSYFIRTTD